MRKAYSLFTQIKMIPTIGGRKMNIWHDISDDRITEDKFLAVIEISKNGKVKYELDKLSGYLKMDRVLYTSTHYPANYGFIPRTYCDDNDPLDVLVLGNEPLVPMCILECKPIGVLIMTDNNERDEKIIAVAINDPNMNSYKDISELPEHIFDEMKHFFRVYKELEGKTTVVDEILGADEAKKIISKSKQAYKKLFSK